jgi:shikimate kinase
MPAAGKSTVGVLLAKQLSRGFLDTDVYIQSLEGRSLRAIIDAEGLNGFRLLEERHVVGLDCHGTVIATGGSVVYGDAAMLHLKQWGTVVYLYMPLASLQARLTDMSARGVLILPGQTLADLLAERDPRYRCYADVVINCDGLSHQEVIDRITTELGCR